MLCCLSSRSTFWLKEDKYIPCRCMKSFVYLRNLATSNILISGFPGWGSSTEVTMIRMCGYISYISLRQHVRELYVFNWFWLKSVSLNIHNTRDHLIQTAMSFYGVGWGTELKGESWRRSGTPILWEWDAYILAGTPTFYRSGVPDSFKILVRTLFVTKNLSHIRKKTGDS